MRNGPTFDIKKGTTQLLSGRKADVLVYEDVDKKSIMVPVKDVHGILQALRRVGIFSGSIESALVALLILSGEHKKYLEKGLKQENGEYKSVWASDIATTDAAIDMIQRALVEYDAKL